jgi:pantoate--beta-alanine ligase
MEVLTRSASVRDRIRQWREAGASVALVPTAGSLHKGHLRLIAEAQERADRVIVSIFAHAAGRESSTQTADRELVQKIGPDVLFTPPIHEIFPFGIENGPVVDVPHLSSVLEGASRPGHFAGLMTVLAKLINITKPDMAVLGERDFQLVVMVRQLVDDLFFSTQVVVCPTARDYDGIAFSSSHRQLSFAQRAVATRLHATLRGVAKRLDAGERDFAALEKEAFEALAGAGMEPEYLGIRQATDLTPARAGSRDLVILAAARIGSLRFVDNLQVRLIDRF